MPEETGSGRIPKRKTTKGLKALGCMPICIARKTIAEMLATGIGEREKLSAKISFRGVA
jgi:hypothetical protein